MENTFHSVWYRPGKKGIFELLAFKDTGTLVVRENGLEFDGTNRLVIAKVVDLSYGKQGTDFINNWVRIIYQDGSAERTAFFADGEWLGWRGILGGTRRLYEAIRTTLPAPSA